MYPISLNSRPAAFSSGGVVWQPLHGNPVWRA
jgi:hypothetical protein